MLAPAARRNNGLVSRMRATGDVTLGLVREALGYPAPLGLDDALAGVEADALLRAATYHRVITVPAGLPAAAEPMVHDSIGAALDAVTRFDLAAALADSVHDAASSAFFRGMQVAAWVGTAVVVCAVIVAYRYLPARATPVRSDDELDEDARLAASLDDGMLT